MIASKIFVKGKVQGVFFRDWTADRAKELGVSGWVRNRRNGSVEVLAIGEAIIVNRFINRLREGPPSSRVDAIYFEDAPIETTKGFTKRQTV